nr:MAG TPA: hypothetical protein [Caudoviricetes sp.]
MSNYRSFYGTSCTRSSTFCTRFMQIRYTFTLSFRPP